METCRSALCKYFLWNHSFAVYCQQENTEGINNVTTNCMYTRTFPAPVPQIHPILIKSPNKRSSFTKLISDPSQLKNVYLLSQRMEQLPNKNMYICTQRAFGFKCQLRNSIRRSRPVSVSLRNENCYKYGARCGFANMSQCQPIFLWFMKCFVYRH